MASPAMRVGSPRQIRSELPVRRCDHAEGGDLRRMTRDRSKSRTILAAAALLLLPTGHGMAQQPKTEPKTEPKTPATAPTAAADIADFFSQVGNRIYEHCIFELSQEQLEVQQALIEAYIKQGATNALARQLAIKQIQPPKLSDECKRIKNMSKESPWTAVATPSPAKNPKTDADSLKTSSKTAALALPLAEKKILPQWDCAPGVDYVTI